MAIVLNGSTQYGQINSALITAAPLTITAWVKLAGAGTVRNVLQLQNASSAQNRNMFRLGVTAGNVAYSQTGGPSSAGAATGSALSTGVWIQLIAEISSASARRILVNGTQQATDTTNLTPSGISRTSLGATWASTVEGFFQEKLAAVALYNRVLTNDEIAALQTKAPRVVSTSGLVDAWDLRADADSVVGGTNWTLVGSPTFDGDAPPVIDWEPLALKGTARITWGGMATPESVLPTIYASDVPKTRFKAK